MPYLDYNSWPRMVQDFFRRFADCPELASTSLNRKYGYFELSRFFGPDAIDPLSVSVRMHDEPFEFYDDRIARFAMEVERTMTTEGRIHTGPNILKLVTADLDGLDKKLTVQPCRYGHHAASCLALDYKQESFGQTDGCLREYYLSQYPSRALCDNPLAVCLGVAAWVIVQQEGGDSLLIVRRSAGLSSLESTLGPSMAGSVEVSNLGDNLFDLLENAISDEAAEELSLSSDEYRLVPLAYGREVFRGERPQLFAALVTELSAREMTEKLDKLDAETREFDEFFFRPLTGILEGKDRVPPEINFEAAMNLLLLREYLSRHPQ